MDKLITKLTFISIADIVFFMIATTVCYLAVIGNITPEQFLSIATMVFSAFYVHKAQNKPTTEPNTIVTTSNKTLTEE